MIEFWAGPSCIDTTARGHLDSLGIRPWSAALDHAPENCAVIYFTPDAGMGQPDILTLFPQMARLAAGGRQACADWRLAGLSPEQCRQWLEGQFDTLSLSSDTQPPNPTALLAAVTRQWLYQDESALHAYLDLEMCSSLFGGSADTDYLLRLQSAIASTELFHQWQSSAANPRIVTELEEVREECDLTLLQLHRLQEEFEKSQIRNRKLSDRTSWLEKKLVEKDKIIGGYEKLLEVIHAHQRRLLLPRGEARRLTAG